jgi:uncharacterized protein YuzE
MHIHRNGFFQQATKERDHDMDGLRVWYDREGDILEVVFEDSPAVMEEIDADVFERRTPDGRVIGFMVMNFSKHDREQLALPLSVTVKSR